MAIVQEITTATARVRIMDDAYASASAEEIEARWEEFYRVAKKIVNGGFVEHGKRNDAERC